MQSIKIKIAKWTLAFTMVIVASLGFAYIFFPPEVAEENTDQKARLILLDMSKSLQNLKEFSFTSKGYFEVIDSLGKKEKMNNSGELLIKRPDKIKVQRTGEKSDIEFYCDGKQVTLFGKKLMYYASAPASTSLDETFDKISEKLDIQLPATDLLYSNVYEGLIQNVVSGKYIGKEKVGNTSCDHLYFKGKDTDFEIWIDELKKLPMKYVIISADIEGKPTAAIEITEWKTNTKLDDNLFTFTPPKGAKKIEFLTSDYDTQSKK